MLALLAEFSPPEAVSIPVPWLNFAIGVLLPAVVALVTHRFADGTVKALVLLFLSALTGVGTQIAANNGDFDVAPAAMAVLTAFGSAVLAHYGLLKPAGVTGSEGVIARAVPGGLGGSGEAYQARHEAGTPNYDPGDPGHLY